MSSNRRQATRTPKRLTVRYGVEDLELTSFTQDISTGGAFLVAHNLLSIGTHLHMRFSWPGGLLYLEGEVVRHHTVHLELRKLEHQGMGIRFLTPAELVEKVVPRNLRSDGEFMLDCVSRDQIKRLLDEQLTMGVLFVPIGDPPPELNQHVTFHIAVVFRATAKRITGTGTIVQILAAGGQERGGRAGAVVKVDDAEAIVQKLQKSLSYGE